MTNELLAAFEGVRSALLRNDSQALTELVADDYRGFDPSGKEHDRNMMLQAYGPNGVDLDVYETRDVTSQVIGEVGLVMGVGKLSGRYEEHEFSHNLRFLDVYVLRGGSWQLLVSQVTEIPVT